MKNRFIRIISPITVAVITILDIAVIGYGIFAVIKLKELMNTTSIIFAAIEVFAIIIAALVSKEVVSNGVVFNDDEVEFTGVDENNIISYDDIKEIEAYKDNAASLTKNFEFRHVLFIFTLKNKKINTIDVGLTTNKTVNKILDEFKERAASADIKFTEMKTTFSLGRKNNNEALNEENNSDVENKNQNKTDEN